MQRKVGSAILELVTGDITEQEVDAIVNAANSQLAGGGGVDGAIHRRGGPILMEETARLYPQGCPTGSAVITSAGGLPCRYVIHAVGPVWHGGGRGERDLLASAYLSCLELAVQHACQSLAFPSLSTGAYGFPIREAAGIALGATVSFLRQQQRPALVRFVLWGDTAHQAFLEALESLEP